MPALKGAFVDIGEGRLLGLIRSTVIFQYNPETISRTPSMSFPPPRANGGGWQNAYDQPEQPTESISFTLRVDASDQLVVQGSSVAKTRGILPTLSALELLMIPKESFARELYQQSGGGTYLSPPYRLPAVLLVWGPFRILPVSFTSMSINETLFDTMLNPVRAEVSVSLQVLMPSQLAPEMKFARDAYEYTTSLKEVMAALNVANAGEAGVRTALSLRP